jgi:hypothetical protein
MRSHRPRHPATARGRSSDAPWPIPACTCCTCPARRCPSAPTPTPRASSTRSRRAGSRARPARLAARRPALGVAQPGSADAAARAPRRPIARRPRPWTRGTTGCSPAAKPPSCCSRTSRSARRSGGCWAPPVILAARLAQAPGYAVAFAVACANWDDRPRCGAAALLLQLAGEPGHGGHQARAPGPERRPGPARRAARIR